MTSKAIYPGSFDPITKGHLDIIDRAGSIFDEVIVAVSNKSQKKFTFNLEERLDLVRTALKGRKFTKVISFECLLVDLAKRMDCYTIIRGLRALSDFEYEFQMALMNRSLNQRVETLFLMPDEKYTYLSSSLIKEIASIGGRISDFIPAGILSKVQKKLEKS